MTDAGTIPEDKPVDAIAGAHTADLLSKFDPLIADAVRAIGMRDDDPAMRPAPQLHDPEPTSRGGHLRLVPVD